MADVTLIEQYEIVKKELAKFYEMSKNISKTMSNDPNCHHADTRRVSYLNPVLRTILNNHFGFEDKANSYTEIKGACLIADNYNKDRFEI